ncbi:4-hydroxy-tetrahydrodipicolinate synthase [Cohaesibacter celericrescens]|uniref:4-hydroxy-tetrahydrodipicolinate synthase n=1 Tax=Cohaesibacter celericrescens TaxID=2067669 RepID=A0A2N5XW32_9HYPH|nr:4-hydroxy-tetrahydrodipicolinate synthase [Cohaesibacter celericrescens]PLW78687.1 4-hydroxy-tetrahydrodipicolinate synthase [Cohaesibacter celericrescens]
MFRGSCTALITPFREGAVDYKAFESFVDWQINEGTHGLVPVGTTGESPTLSHDEHKKVVEACVAVADKRVPVLAGAGSNSTSEAIDLAKHAETAGADGALVVTPYYNKPGQEGLYQHYKAIASAVSIPIIIYNIPPRSVIDMSVETMTRLFEDCENIIGVKDATADLTRVTRQRLAMGKEFLQMSGEDGTALGYNAHGGHGCISVTSNVAPKLCSQFQEACMNGEWDRALELHDILSPLHRALFLEPNPTGAKYALSVLGKIENQIRLPLTAATDPVKAQIEAAMKVAGLI